MAYWATEDPADLAHAIIYAAHHRDFIRRLGENAAESVYLPWQAAVKEAYERYGAIVDGFVPRYVSALSCLCLF